MRLATLVPIVCTLWASSCASVDTTSTAPLRAGSNFLHPPFSSRDDQNRPIGIEVDIIAEAAQQMGREVLWVDTPFGDLIPAVARGDLDIAASTIGIRAERARHVAFSAPYFETTIVVLTRIGEHEPQRLSDLAGRRIGTERSTSAVAAATQRVPDAIRVLDRDTGKTWAEMLQAGAIDAVVLDHSHAEKFMRDAGTQFHVIGEPLQVERFGLAVQHEAGALRQALDLVISAQHAR